MCLTPAAPLAWTPFIDPLPYYGTTGWLLLFIPLVLLVSTAYKTIKLDDLSRLPREAVKLSAQILVFMGLAALSLWLVTEMF